MDNLDGYDSSHDFLLGGEEHSNAFANENSKGFLPKMRSNPKGTLDLVTFTEESLMENFIFFAVSGAQLEMFQGSRAFVEFGHFHKPFVKNTKKGPARKHCVVFSPRYLWSYILNGKFNTKMDTIKALFAIFEREQWTPPPPTPYPPFLVARLSFN